ncbi:CHASE2 domain-containing protein [Thalassotalea fusca]
MSITSKRNINTSIVAAVLFVVTVLVFKTQIFITLDYRMFDWQLNAKAPDVIADNDIVVIDIDDHSINAMNQVVGRWSWPRSVYAEVIEQLLLVGSDAIVIDILFAENDIYRPDDDAYFKEVIAGTTNVYFASLMLNSDSSSGTLLSELSHQTKLEATPAAHEAARLHFVLPTVVNPNYENVGIINASFDIDDVLRRYSIFQQRYGWKIYSLPAVVALGLGYELPNQQQIILSWPTGGQRPYKTYSFVDVYKAVVEGDEQLLSELTNKIVLVGASAAGLFDAHNTPIHAELPGVYSLAAAIDNLKNNRFVQPADQTLLVAFYLIVFVLFHLTFAFFDSYSKQILGGIIIFTAASAITTLWSFWSLVHLQQLLVVTPILCWLLILLTLSIVHGYLEYSQRQYALSVFGRFLDPNIVNTLYEEGELEIAQLNKKSKVTVMFSDIRNFTHLSEQHQANEVLALLNQYFAYQVGVIFKHNGTLDKFIGDCIMAFWGAPKPDDRQAINAIEAALAMSEFIEEFRLSLPHELTDFDIGIGIHTGEAIVGLVGTELRVDYTVIGDTVNVASRIEGLTKGLSRILVSKETMTAAQCSFTFEFVGKFSVKGREHQVELYRPTGRKK